MSLALDVPEFWLYQGSEYAKILNISEFWISQDYIHCVKSIQIRSYFWSVFSCIWFEFGALLLDTFYAVIRHRTCLNRSWLYLNMPDHVCIDLNMLEYAGICVNMLKFVWMDFVLHFPCSFITLQVVS